jgi:hypothetical protein
MYKAITAIIEYANNGNGNGGNDNRREEYDRGRVRQAKKYCLHQKQQSTWLGMA